MPFESKTKYGTQRDNTELILRTLESIKRVLQAINIAGPGGDATLAEQQSQTTLLTSIDSFVNSIDTIITGQATLTEQQLQTAELVSIASDVIVLSNMDNRLGDISTWLQKDTWDKIAGNSTEYTYIAGTLVPTDFLVQTIVYKTGAATVFTRTFIYDANDNVTSITAS